MDVSVIIPTYNRKEVLKVVLNSLFNQDYPKNKFEIIVIDGGSDNTNKMINKLRQKSPCKILYFYQKRWGFHPGAARNIGIKNASGKILIFLDSDVVVVSTFISQHVSALNKNRRSVIIGYSSYYKSTEKVGHELKEFKNIEKINNVKVKNERREIFYQLCKDDLSKLKSPWRLLFGNNFSIRKKDMVLFDENFVGWGYEDIDVGIRLYNNKIKFILNRKALGYNIKIKKNNFCPFSNPSIKNCISTLANLRILMGKHKINEVIDYCRDEIEGIDFFKKKNKLYK